MLSIRVPTPPRPGPQPHNRHCPGTLMAALRSVHRPRPRDPDSLTTWSDLDRLAERIDALERIVALLADRLRGAA